MMRLVPLLRASALPLLLVALSGCTELSTTPEEGLTPTALFARKGEGTSRTAVWTGNGTSGTGAEFALNDSRCNEAGDPYLYWVLTAQGSPSATIRIGDSTEAMSRVSNGSYKYTQSFSGGVFVEPTAVTADYIDTRAANLVVGHGCTGPESADPASVKLIFSGDFSGADVIWALIDPVSNADCTLNAGPETFDRFNNIYAAPDGFVTVCFPPANGNLLLRGLGGSNPISALTSGVACGGLSGGEIRCTVSQPRQTITLASPTN